MKMFVKITLYVITNLVKNLDDVILILLSIFKLAWKQTFRFVKFLRIYKKKKFVEFVDKKL